MTNNKAGVLFWLSPVLGIAEAFRNLKDKQSRLVLFGFCLCFGICFSVGTERIEGSVDGISMRQEFEETKDLTTQQYFTYLSDYFECQVKWLRNHPSSGELFIHSPSDLFSEIERIVLIHSLYHSLDENRGLILAELF